MAKFVVFLAVALVVLVSVNAADELRKCYQCTSCKDVSEKKATDCADASLKGCFIRGDPDKETWARGCAPDEETACAALADGHECSFCEEDECNSGSFVAASIMMTVGLAAIVNMMRFYQRPSNYRMAKFVVFLAVALVVLVSVNAEEDALRKCYQCNSCKDVSEKKATDCANANQKGCYIRGDPDKENWDRGCEVDEKTACAKEESDTYKCSFCEEDECNSGSFVAASIMMTVGLAAIVNMMR
ncbi:uncharacterized protein [Atheta coriaria]|uniref:uncharacterized protein n=1 Tax=Dalotia coriaria TaxID=877792 RepID=UPI0031F47121